MAAQHFCLCRRPALLHSSFPESSSSEEGSSFDVTSHFSVHSSCEEYFSMVVYAQEGSRRQSCLEKTSVCWQSLPCS